MTALASEVVADSPVARLARWLRSARLGALQGGGLWGSVVVVVVFLAISIPQYWQPYVIDEAVFPYVADGILKNGAPYFYNGEFRPSDLGLWHPPLYDYLLAGHLWLWGVSPFAVRSFGAICVILTFFVLTLALRRIAPSMRQHGYVIMGALFMLNPLVISDALVPDIDGTLGVLVVALALWTATVVALDALSWRMMLWLVGLAALAVSTKFILAGIVAVIVGCAALLAYSQRWRKALCVVVAFTIGTQVSLAAQFALGAILRFDAAGPFSYLFGSLGTRPPGRSGLGGTLASLMSGPGSNVIWIGPALLVAAIASLVVVLIAKPTGVRRSLAALILGSSLAIVVGYSYITASPFLFPKYTAVAVPGLALVAALVVNVASPFTLSSGRSRAVTRMLVSALVLVLLIGTAGMFLLDRRTQPRSLGELAELSVGVFAGVLLVKLILTVALRPTDHMPPMRLALMGTIAALVLAPIMIQISSSLVNASSQFSTRYYYGERGMAEFLTKAGEIIPAGETVIAAKDIGLQLERPFYEDAGLLPLPPAELRAELERINAPYLVTRNLHDYSETAYPDQFDVLRELYVPVLADRDSDFRLWGLK